MPGQCSPCEFAIPGEQMKDERSEAESAEEDRATAASMNPSTAPATIGWPVTDDTAMTIVKIAASAWANRRGGGAGPSGASPLRAAIRWLSSASNGLSSGNSALHARTAENARNKSGDRKTMPTSTITPTIRGCTCSARYGRGTSAHWGFRSPAA